MFTVPDMSNPKLSSLVATKVAHWHKLHLPGGEQPRLFLTLWKWFNGIPKKYAVKETQANFETNVNLAKLRGEIEKLESILTGLNSPVVFCHNDLLSGNIIYEEHREDVSFIDFEYGCGNYRGYDIGNHFCEWAGFQCDYSLYPGKDQQLVWLRTYWKGFYGTEPTPLELEDFYLEVNLFALASHLYWGLWGLVQALFSDIPFDYMSYAVMRFKEYERTKELWFNLYATNNRD